MATSFVRCNCILAAFPEVYHFPSRCPDTPQAVSIVSLAVGAGESREHTGTRGARARLAVGGAPDVATFARLS